MVEARWGHRVHLSNSAGSCSYGFKYITWGSCSRPVDSAMDPNLKLLANQSEMCPDPERYRRLVGKLIYLTITRPDISFAVGVVSQFMQNPRVDHWNAVMVVIVVC